MSQSTRIENTSSDRVAVIYQNLCERFAQLGIPIWYCDGEGAIVARSEQPRELRGWLQSGDLNRQVEQAARSMCGSGRIEPQEVAPGFWLVPVEHRSSSGRLALYLALLLTDAAQEAPQEVGRFSEAEVRRLWVILRWIHQELVRAEDDRQTIEQFSEKLAQAYEETNLVYRMAKLLHCNTEPAQSIQTLGHQLQQVLPFGWVAIRFNNRGTGVPDLAGQTVIAGRPPCDLAVLQQLSDPMLQRSNRQDWKRLLDPQTDPLAGATGSEVLCEPITHDDQVVGVLLAGNKSGPDPQLSSFEIQFMNATADFLGVFHENLARLAEQQEMFLGTLGALTAAIDAKDAYTRGHSERVGLMACRMALALGMDKQLAEQYRIAGLVHDVGKIGVPESVLGKPGKLTEDEFALVKLHTQIGYNILKDIPALAPMLPGVLWHHERWDGQGYPHRLAGQNIPLQARVMALADTFDAMSSHRSYRPALPREKVLQEMRNSAGGQFDPDLVPLFISLDFSDFDHVLATHKAREHRAA